MVNSKKIKKEIKTDSLIIRLYDVKCKNINESVANIEEFNLQGTLIWTIQSPLVIFTLIYKLMKIASC